MPDVSIVVLSHNRSDDLQALLLALGRDKNLAGVEIIVVDNASTDGSRELLCELKLEYPAMRVVLNETNLGVAAGRNTGLRRCRTIYAICLDDDALMSSEGIRKVPLVFAKHPTAGILAFKVLHARTGDLQNPHGDVVVPVANFHGAGFALRTESLTKVGYFDERCSFGGEELDFSIRCHAKGYSTLFIPEIVVQHNSLVRLGNVGAERRTKWLYNYVRVLFKHFPKRTAYLFSARYLFLAMTWSYSIFGLGFIFKLLNAARMGRNDGARVSAMLPDETMTFYKNPGLRPEYGNVPLHLQSRVLRKCRKTVTRISSKVAKSGKHSLGSENTTES